ncbi:MAG: FtsH protease activity modulator HflK, partial [Acidobacteria bacterium]|nr:FtsH protease activity modulator HflK [Candidatus Polarisedimenticola svalbardensis]
MDSKGPRVIDVRNFHPPNIPIRGIAGGILVLILIALAASTVFQVGAEEVGVILRFGEYVGVREPGLQFKLPYPVDRVFKVAVQRQLKSEFGFRTESAGVRSRYSVANLEDESLMLTGDLNVADVEWTAQFRITDPYKFLFKVRNMEDTFRDMNEAVMRQVIGDRSVNEVLTIGRQEIADRAELLLQELCDQYETGIRVDQIVLQNVNPPDEVKPSFNEVNQAQQEKERRINEARSAFNKVIPKAQGEAKRTVQAAEGYATDRVNRAEGDVAAFNFLLDAYRRAPDVTRRRMYLETMGTIYPKVKRKIILDKD